MNQNIEILNNPSLNMVKGFYSNAICCEIKKKDKLDLGLLYTEREASVFAKFTKNKALAAPIILSKEFLKKSKNKCNAIIVNSGNANACTGKEGIENAKKICAEVAKNLGIKKEKVLPSSTGVIGVQLPVDKIIKKIPELIEKLKEQNDKNFSYSIMTTDTVEKISGVKVKIKDNYYHIVGTAKGSGMIHPNLATMLCYIITDVNISDKLLKQSFNKSIEDSFNSITVDGDTSTNDTVMILSNKSVQNKKIDKKNSEEYKIFCEALNYICISLAKMIVKDGEGATKFIEINIQNSKNKKTAKIIGKSIANSLLVKTAFFGEDANWGRIICAIGYSNANIDINKVELSFDNLVVFKNGKNTDYNEKDASEIFKKKNITVNVNLNSGKYNTTIWTTDLSYDYVKINGSYRT